MPQSFIVDTTHSRHARLKPVAVSAVRLEDDFWQPRRAINAATTLPSQFQHLESTGRLNNFRRAAGGFDGPFEGSYFNDSDVYKWLEAAAWQLACGPDAGLKAMVDETISVITAAQQSDGYLNSYFMFELEGERWSDLKDKHELYCAGHFIQAAVAHFRASGENELLGVARRLADCICGVFGPASEGKQEQTDGHEEIEMALIELSRATGEERYFKQAQFFLNVRGRGMIGGRNYHQDDVPLREQMRMAGHAVRHVYYNCGAADLVAENGDDLVRAALERLWHNMAHRQMYVSGGIGSRHEGEAFGRDYELPAERAYAETCAAIGSVMWNWRMLQLDADARFADIMELALYNGVLAGISLDGQSYFYVNPLTSEGTHRRKEWFGCACCPPNMARLLAQLPGYFYSHSSEGIWAHFYASSTARLPLSGGGEVVLKQRTRYPWDGEIEFTIEEVSSDAEWTFFLRVPQWCRSFTRPKINGIPSALARGTQGNADYLPLRRAWKSGDSISLSFTMPPRRVECHPYVTENQNHVALMRGPLLYCLEAVDHAGCDLRDVTLPIRARLTTEKREQLGGITALVTTGEENALTSEADDLLYFSGYNRPKKHAARPVEITAVPYYAWANRAAGRMLVWVRTR